MVHDNLLAGASRLALGADVVRDDNGRTKSEPDGYNVDEPALR